MSLKNYFLKRLCYFLVILTSFYGFIFAQTITVDGDPSDWPAALNGNMVKAFVHDRANVSDDNKFDASKDVEDTPLWDWSIGQVNDKGDITNAGAVLINGDELYFFGDRTAINGDAQIGFWFFQNGTRPVGTTSGNFAPEHAIGDLLILSNFTNGGGQVTIRVYRWVGSGGSEGSLDLVTRTSKAVVNTQYVSAPSYPGWTYQGKNVPSVGTPPPNTYATGSFFEGYVKLERLIETCYASFLMETRNSASVDAALEDFAFGEYNGKPQAPKVTAGSICGPGVVQLSAECSSTDNAVVRWYDAPTGGNLLFTGSNYAPNISQTTTYYVACFRGDGLGCESTRTPVVATVNPKPEVSLSFDPIKCNGDNTTLVANVTSGTAPYTYLWSNGEKTSSISVKAGTYSVVVTDSKGCEVSKEITISEPSKLSMEVSYTPILCNGGKSTVTVSANGGTAPYTGTGSWEVSAGTYTYTVKDANGCEVSKEITISEPSKLSMEVSYTPILCNGGKSTVTVSANGGTAPYTGTGSWEVSAGIYTYTVKDANGCEVSKEITISEPSKLSMEVSYTPILCNGGKSTVTVSANGGTAPYTGTGSWEVSVGTYTYTVKDANGCEVSKEITITQPTPLELTIVAEKLVCYDGKVQLTANVSGGTSPYTYSWSNGETTQMITVGAGSYTVTVKDANGCMISKNVEVKVPTCDGFTTVTQGGWGAKAAGKNWGAYRDANFAAAFPTGLMVGTALRNLKLSSAKAVDDFLPSGSSPRALENSYVNPGQTYQNVFAGQVVALTLSVRFDEWDANFSSNSIKLGDLIVNSGTFAGWTVYQILAEANKVLAGEASMYSASQLNAIVDAINNNYDNGKVNLGLLSCPCPTVEKPVAKVAAPAKSTPDVIANQEAVLYPNPSSGEFNLRFDAPKESKILVQIYNAQGTLVADYSSKVVRNNNKASLHVNNSNLAAGLYLVKVKTSTQEKTIKLIIRK